MITADQLLAHAIGDYVLQSDWMASEKLRRLRVALVHGLAYGLPFLIFKPSLTAWAVIVGSHAVIDRWRLARYVGWLKNLLAPLHARRPWRMCEATGYGPDKPVWMAVWLMIIVDNILHVTINGAALTWL